MRPYYNYNYEYIRTIINQQWNHSQDNRCRMEQVSNILKNGTTFQKQKSENEHQNKTSSMLRLLGIAVWSRHMDFDGGYHKKLQFYEIWLYRIIQRISWTDRVKLN